MTLTEQKKKYLTTGPLFAKMILFILPVLASNLLQIFYNAADMMIVGLSAEQNAVGAIGTAIPIFILALTSLKRLKSTESNTSQS